MSLIGLGKSDGKVEEGKEKGRQQYEEEIETKRVGKIIHVAKIFGMYLRDLKG